MYRLTWGSSALNCRATVQVPSVLALSAMVMTK